MTVSAIFAIVILTLLAANATACGVYMIKMKKKRTDKYWSIAFFITAAIIMYLNGEIIKTEIQNL